MDQHNDHDQNENEQPLPPRREDNLHHHGRAGKVWKVILLVLVLIVTAGAAYGVRLATQVKDSADKTYVPTKKKTPTVNLADQKPFSILLLGADTGTEGRDGYRGNSDTMILVTVDPQKKETTLFSIPRDTAAQIIGAKTFTYQKINSAFNIGGPSMAMDTVEKLLNVPINYYALIDMAGMKKMVDAVDGIDVDVPFSFVSTETGNQKFTKGKMHLNGDMALAYARMRKEDNEGDFGRQKRQQQVITAIAGKVISLNSLTRVQSILDAVSSSIQTNIKLGQLMTMYQNYQGALKNIKQDGLKGIGTTVNDNGQEVAYVVTKTSELQRVSDKARTALGLDTETLNNEETRQNSLQTTFDWNSQLDQFSYTFYPQESGGSN
ncbi:LCP family protein [Schleiferilactobacillus shenzhenensis]|uniref:LytR n=1 Tax=Schleiferilactobacillus shenzhenensis LY-73 TaxID=1231336 RepID=U4TNZ6_9LACO|nr:LCP family protein [Schleiferilactobacillus shenzhenensis]ERL66616.1 LytR [Schleiferilactobacillus shenzhenensis LY-73]